MLSFIKGFSLLSSIKLLVFSTLALLAFFAYQNHQALKAQVLEQQEAIGIYKQSQAQAKQTNNENNQAISFLKARIIAQQKQQARHEKSLLIAQANQAKTNQELADLRAQNENVKQWLDTSHDSAISRLLNNARARYTNDSKKRNN